MGIIRVPPVPMEKIVYEGTFLFFELHYRKVGEMDAPVSQHPHKQFNVLEKQFQKFAMSSTLQLILKGLEVKRNWKCTEGTWKALKRCRALSRGRACSNAAISSTRTRASSKDRPGVIASL